jgi:hypothetical protein
LDYGVVLHIEFYNLHFRLENVLTEARSSPGSFFVTAYLLVKSSNERHLTHVLKATIFAPLAVDLNYSQMSSLQIVFQIRSGKLEKVWPGKF